MRYHLQHGGKPQTMSLGTSFDESRLPKLNSTNFLPLNDIDFQCCSNLFLIVFVYL